MSPYRSDGRPERGRPDAPPPDADDDGVILWIALVVALVGLAPQLGARGAWGAEPTVALAIALASGIALLRRAYGRGRAARGRRSR
jgi:hypothetical protein